MKLIFCRHGETDWNAEGRMQGHADIPLNQIGINQAYNLKERLKDIKIDFIFSSPLKRALETAEIINESLHIPLIIEPALIERDLGKYEGLTRSEIEKMGINIHLELDNKIPTVESALEIEERIYNLLDKLKREYEDKTILIVSHGGVGKVVYWYFNSPKINGKPTRISDVSVMDNSAIIEYNS